MPCSHQGLFIWLQILHFRLIQQKTGKHSCVASLWLACLASVCKIAAYVWAFSLKHWTSLLTLFFTSSLPPASSKGTPQVGSPFPKSPRTLFYQIIYPTAGHEVSRHEPFPSPPSLWDRIVTKRFCPVRSACPVPSCRHLTCPWGARSWCVGARATYGGVCRHRGTWTNRHSSRAAACCFCSYATWGSALTLNVPPVGCTPTVLASKQLSMKTVLHINITLWSKTLILRTFVLNIFIQT